MHREKRTLHIIRHIRHSVEIARLLPSRICSLVYTQMAGPVSKDSVRVTVSIGVFRKAEGIHCRSPDRLAERLRHPNALSRASAGEALMVVPSQFQVAAAGSKAGEIAGTNMEQIGCEVKRIFCATTVETTVRVTETHAVGHCYAPDRAAESTLAPLNFPSYARGAHHRRYSARKISIVSLNLTMTGLSRSDARAVEQALIEIHGLGKNGGTLLNKINSIAASNPTYAAQLQRGYALLKTIGYK